MLRNGRPLSPVASLKNRLDRCVPNSSRSEIREEVSYHKANRTIEHFIKEGNFSVITPSNNPKGAQLTDDQKAFNRILSVVRAIVERRGREGLVWFCESALPWFGEASRANCDAVCTG